MSKKLTNEENLSNDDLPADLAGLSGKGIPVWKAEFQCAVNNTDDVPETNFSTQSATKSRQVKMWWILGNGLLCWHNGEYFLVPSATVKYCKFG